MPARASRPSADAFRCTSSYLIELDRAPQAIDENVVHETPAPVHRNRGARGVKLAGERGAGELRALIPKVSFQGIRPSIHPISGHLDPSLYAGMFL
jgi:hypothetical protein